MSKVGQVTGQIVTDINVCGASYHPSRLYAHMPLHMYTPCFKGYYCEKQGGEGWRGLAQAQLGGVIAGGTGVGGRCGQPWKHSFNGQWLRCCRIGCGHDEERACH